jgi:hypothetical protein
VRQANGSVDNASHVMIWGPNQAMDGKRQSPWPHLECVHMASPAQLLEPTVHGSSAAIQAAMVLYSPVVCSLCHSGIMYIAAPSWLWCLAAGACHWHLTVVLYCTVDGCCPTSCYSTDLTSPRASLLGHMVVVIVHKHQLLHQLRSRS